MKYSKKDQDEKQYLVTRHKEIKELYQDQDINKVIHVDFKKGVVIDAPKTKRRRLRKVA